MKSLHIGTSGWFYKDWKTRFYPRGMPSEKYLPYYSGFFDTVELNAPFYRLPQPEMVQGWHQRAPKNFLFAYKASRFITHIKKLLSPKGALQLMFHRADLLKEKLGPILYQLPPGFSVNVERLKKFLAMLPTEYEHIMEFRHPSWFTNDVYDALQKKNISLCFYDMKGDPSPQVITGTRIYIRFHGSEDKYAGGYTNPVLKSWARLIKRWNKTYPVYAYFNNDIRGHAIRNAQTLKGLLS